MAKSTAQDRILPPFKKAANENASKEAEDQPANADDYLFFGLAHNQANPVGFQITFAAGNVAAIYYHDIISPLEYDGSGIIKISTPSIDIKITGKNLGVLFDFLFESRVAWIKEPDSSFVQPGEDQPEIESIKLEIKA